MPNKLDQSMTSIINNGTLLKEPYKYPIVPIEWPKEPAQNTMIFKSSQTYGSSIFNNIKILWIGTYNMLGESLELFDGLTTIECYNKYRSNMMSEGKNWTLTPMQLVAARTEWSRQLKELTQVAKKKDRMQVVVDHYDIDD